MSWRQSSGRDCCTTCRATIDLGAPLYVGELTPALWCLGCAGTELGRAPDGPVPRHVAGAWRAIDIKAMSAKLRESILARRGRERDGRQAATGERE